jgi:hypothetical protein
VRETQSMIPDTASRLCTAMEDLQIILDDSSPEEESSPEFLAANGVLKDAADVLDDDE